MTLSAEWPNINFCERQFLRNGRRQFLELHVRTTRRIGFCRNRSTPPGKLFGMFPNDCLSVILERHMSVDHIPTNLFGELLSPNCAIQWILPLQSHTCWDLIVFNFSFVKQAISKGSVWWMIISIVKCFLWDLAALLYDNNKKLQFFEVFERLRFQAFVVLCH